MIRQTHTYATLEVSAATFEEIKQRIHAAGEDYTKMYIQRDSDKREIIYYGGDIALVREKENPLTARNIIEGTLQMLDNCKVESGVCCCGRALGEGHGCDNHSYTDSGESYAAGLKNQIEGYLGNSPYKEDEKDIPKIELDFKFPNGSHVWTSPDYIGPEIKADAPPSLCVHGMENTQHCAYCRNGATSIPQPDAQGKYGKAMDGPEEIGGQFGTADMDHPDDCDCDKCAASDHLSNDYD